MPRMRLIVWLNLLLVALAGLGHPALAQLPSSPPPRRGPSLSPVLPERAPAFSFGFIGCNRLPVKDAERQPGAAPNLTANRAQLEQTVRDLEKLEAGLLFIAGDFVMNEAADSTTLPLQLEAWSLEWSRLDTRLPLYLTPGNHEMVYHDKEKEIPNPACGPSYRAWLAAHPEYNAGITPGPTPASTYPGASADALADDQSAMSYVLDIPAAKLSDPRFPQARVVRLVALNADTLTTLPEDDPPFWGSGRAPSNWLASVVAEAQDDPRIGAVIVMSHRPLSRIGGEEMEMAPPYNARVYEVLAAATYSPSNPNGKVRAYLCAHAHMHDVSQLVGPPEAMTQRNSLEGENLGLYQIVAGCCGSPLEKRWSSQPTWGPGLPHLGIAYLDAQGQQRSEPYFGFQYVTVGVDGTVEVFNFGRAINPPYSRETYLEGPVTPARPLSSVVVYP